VVGRELAVAVRTAEIVECEMPVFLANSVPVIRFDSINIPNIAACDASGIG
jgi:hypothetical protein